MPTTPTNTYVENVGTPSQWPSRASKERKQMVASTTLDPGASPKKFIAVAIITASGKLAAYNDALATGAEVCKGLLPYKAVSSASGAITVNGGNAMGTTEDTAEYYSGGYFLTAEITGLDAAGLADMQGKLLWGDLTTGEIHIPA